MAVTWREQKNQELQIGKKEEIVSLPEGLGVIS